MGETRLPIYGKLLILQAVLLVPSTMFIAYVLFFATCQSLSKEWISRRMVVENHKVLCSRYVGVYWFD